MSHQPRLFVEQDLVKDQPVPASDEARHYLMNVMRLAAGDMCRLFNGRDGEWHVRLELFSKKKLAFIPERLLREQTIETGPVLYFAPIKRQRMTLLIEKACELGVEKLQPVLTERSRSERYQHERNRVIAIEACEQCERMTLAELCEPVAFSALDISQPLLLLDETGQGEPLASVAGTMNYPALFVGPEGGFTASELASLRTNAYVRSVDLGPRILRAETAAIAALAIVQAMPDFLHSKDLDQ